MSDWTWEYDPDDLPDGLPPEALVEIKELAEKLAERDSMLYLDGPGYDGDDEPGLRELSTPRLILVYLTDIRRERIVIVQLTWFG